MHYETLTHEIADGILTLTLNRPDKLNAFVLRMGEELIQAFNEASENDAARHTGDATGDMCVSIESNVRFCSTVAMIGRVECERASR